MINRKLKNHLNQKMIMMNINIYNFYSIINIILFIFLLNNYKNISNIYLLKNKFIFKFYIKIIIKNNIN